MALKLGIIGGSEACSPQPTGVGYYIRYLLWALVDLDLPAGTRLIFYLPPQSLLVTPLPEPKEKGKVTYVYRPAWVPRRLHNLWIAVRSHLDRLDAIYSTAFYHLFPRYVRGLKITTVFDVIFKDFPEFYTPENAASLDQLVGAALNQADAAAVCSQATASSIEKNYGYPRPLFPLDGAARPQFKTSQVEPHSDHGLFFLCVGRLDRRKNITGAVQAYRQLVQKGYDCSLILAGPPDSGSDELLALLSHKKIPGEKIHVTGYLEEEELLKLYHSCRGFLFPSHAEGLGLPILEALACGAPTVVADRSPARDLVGNAALLIDPLSVESLQQAMESLLTNEGLVQELKGAGPLRAAQYSWPESAGRLLASVSKLLLKSRSL